MGIEEKVSQATERISEFYDIEILSDYVKFCHKELVPYDQSMLFLDGQTRADYWIQQGRYAPKIWEYMDRVKIWYFSGGGQ